MATFGDAVWTALVRWAPMRTLARVNRRITNPLFRARAAHIEGYGNVIHYGRRSGRRYRTPVAITRHGDELTIPLNYGQGSDWVRNILAANEFQLEHQDILIHVHTPEIITIGPRQFIRAIAAPGGARQ
ncbi:nitroreductase/quinone reductase family protein [Nocardia sp. NPDC051030]|uniref:nitroreductase/quinone reductase family protein n=1 Tax=Nocardia sp. NPDC051030 TaxID=3155162 RepID=UPI00341CB8E3